LLWLRSGWSSRRTGAGSGGDLMPSRGGAGIAQVDGLLGVKGSIGRACRRDVSAEVFRPLPLPVRMFENAQSADCLVASGLRAGPWCRRVPSR
jgi:hypothetical protein